MILINAANPVKEIKGSANKKIQPIEDLGPEFKIIENIGFKSELEHQQYKRVEFKAETIKGQKYAEYLQRYAQNYCLKGLCTVEHNIDRKPTGKFFEVDDVRGTVIGIESDLKSFIKKLVPIGKKGQKKFNITQDTHFKHEMHDDVDKVKYDDFEIFETYK